MLARTSGAPKFISQTAPFNATTKLRISSQAPRRPAFHRYRRSELSAVPRPDRQELLDQATRDAIKKAELECKDEKAGTKDCEVAWDQAEELLAHKSHMKGKKEEKDILDQYCDDQPDADECRVYES